MKIERLSGATSAEANGPPRDSSIGALAWVIACTVGSAFEADWAYLQHARVLMPDTYGSLLDRWRGWFVHCDPEAPFPQFTKTSTPGSPPIGRRGVYIGPMTDKHAAQKLIDILVSTFDLCRYHHILVQSPHGCACAYKEMGRCPAPCDGTVPMARYCNQIRDAIECASSPLTWRTATESAMNIASQGRSFEEAGRFKRMLDDASGLARSEFRLIKPLSQFRYMAVMPGESRDHGRVFLIDRGWIAPLFDTSLDASESDIASCLHSAGQLVQSTWRFEFQRQAIENIGLVCWHMLRPQLHRDPTPAEAQRDRATKARATGDFLAINENLNAKAVVGAIRRLQRHSPEAHDTLDLVADHSLDAPT